ncbi:MAG: aminoglycoside phosphotransferase family protein [bacterium]|nr:aminoglycoside phosphotransferase family protein [bacterium]
MRGELTDIVNRAYSFTKSNAKQLGIGAAVGTGTWFGVDGYERLWGFEDNFSQIAIPPLVGWIAYEVADYRIKIQEYTKKHGKRIPKIKKTKNYKSNLKGAKRAIGYVLEEPRIKIGSAAASILVSVPISSLWVSDNDAAQMGVIAGLTTMGYFSFQYVGKTASMLFHPENWNFMKSLTKYAMYSTRDKKKRAEVMKETVKPTSSNPLTYNMLAEFNWSLGDIDQAFILNVKALEIIQQETQGPFYTLDNKVFHWAHENSLVKKVNKIEKKENASIDELVFSSMCHLMLNNPAAAVATLENLDRTEHKREIDVLEGILLGYTDEGKAAEKWRYIFNDVLQDESLKKEQLGETVNDVYVLGPSKFLSGMFVFKEGKRENLEKEHGLTSYVEKLLSDYNRYDVPTPLHVGDDVYKEIAQGMKPSHLERNFLFQKSASQEQGATDFCYVMRHVAGETLYERVKRGENDDFSDVAEFLALLHAKIPEEMSEKGRLDLEKKLKAGLENENLKAGEDLVAKILDNYTPVFNTFKSAVYGFNKDAHPENWIITENGIVAIDIEDKGFTPVQFDLVNLMEYGKYLDDNEKDAVIDAYINAYNEFAGENVIEDKKQFKLTYLNSVVQRAIALSSAWSSPLRVSLHAHRAIVLDNALHAIDRIETSAIHAIDRIEKEHANYFKEHEENYVNLREALGELKTLVSSC